MNLDIVLGFVFGMLFGGMTMHIIWLRQLLQASLKDVIRIDSKLKETEIVTGNLQRRAFFHSVSIHNLEKVVGKATDHPSVQPLN